MRKALLAGMALAGLGAAAAAHAEDYMSQVDLIAESSCDCAKGDVNGKTAIIGRVSVPFKSKVTYKIGWSTYPSGGGSELSHRSDIGAPEYILFGKDFPPGLHFVSETGFVEGVPTTPGQWEIRPAVRDKVKGESPYRGQGFWWTNFRTYEGKTWSQAKDYTVLAILPAPTGKEFRLQCTAQGHNGARLIVEVDYDNKLVKFIGSNGQIAGAYNVSVDPDVIGWNKMQGPLYANSAMLDRKTGQLTYRAAVDNRELAYSCEKRSEQQKF